MFMREEVRYSPDIVSIPHPQRAWVGVGTTTLTGVGIIKEF